MRHCALPIFRHIFITLAASSRKRTVTVSRPSVCLFVCPVGILTVTHQGTACDAASVHFGPTACLHKLSLPKTTAWVMLRPTDKYFHRMVMLLRVAITLLRLNKFVWRTATDSDLRHCGVLLLVHFRHLFRGDCVQYRLRRLSMLWRTLCPVVSRRAV